MNILKFEVLIGAQGVDRRQMELVGMKATTRPSGLVYLYMGERPERRGAASQFSTSDCAFYIRALHCTRRPSPFRRCSRLHYRPSSCD